MMDFNVRKISVWFDDDVFEIVKFYAVVVYIVRGVI